VSVEDRLPAVQKFHKTLQAFVSEEGDSNDPIYGRFKPENIFNMDQSPIMLDCGSSVTCEKKGAVTVGVSRRKSSDKRFATLTICVRLDGGPSAPVEQPPPSVIFKGQGKISQKERAAYAPGVIVQFQTNAWTDGKTLPEWLDGFCNWAKIKTDSGRKLFFLDNLKAQATPEFREELAKRGLVGWYFPPNTTDIVQPVDRHLAQQMKVKISRLLDEKLLQDGEFRNRFLGLENGKFSASDCRILLTHLIAQAWKEVSLERNFLELGWHTGCVMPKEGINRKLHGIDAIRITGLKVPYQFESVVIEKPTEPGAVDSIVDNDDEGLESVKKMKPISSADVSQKSKGKSAGKGKTVLDDSSSSDSSSEGEVIDGESDQDSSVREHHSSGDNVLRISTNDEVLEGTHVVNPFNEGVLDDDEISENADIFKEDALDDTSDNQSEYPPVAPEGFQLSPRPTEFPSFTKLLHRKVYWYIPLTANGSAGWIIAKITGGPPDPVSAAMGNTVRLSCTKRLDSNTPNFLCTGKTEHPACFTVGNYGSRWFILEACL